MNVRGSLSRADEIRIAFVAMPVHPYGNVHPTVDPTAFIAPGASVVGDVTLGAHQLAAQLLELRGQVGDGIGIGHEISISGSGGSGLGMSPRVSTDSHHCR